jgi:hypothetical protein
VRCRRIRLRPVLRRGLVPSASEAAQSMRLATKTGMVRSVLAS